MVRSIFLAAAVLPLALCVIATPGYAANAELVSVTTPRGVKQAFIFISVPHPTASVVLFAGGHGGLGLNGPSSMNWGGGNFLVRSRNSFAAQGLNVAVVDAPSDRKRMNAIFRMSSAHAVDIGAVSRYLRSRARVPVWLVGTSMGTFSAANGAIASPSVSGLVLTSTVSAANRRWKIARSHPRGVASMALDRVRVPALIVAHKRDTCYLTPPSETTRLREALRNAQPVKAALVDGGLPPRSSACQARSAHGFLGIENSVVRSIAIFIRANSR
jgi:dienelactone hydrolase